GDFHAAVVTQVAAAEIEGANDRIFAAADEKPPAVRGKGDAVEGLFDGGFRDDVRPAAAEIDYDDVVFPIATMEHGEELAVGMDRDIHREVIELELRPRGPEPPLVG